MACGPICTVTAAAVVDAEAVAEVVAADLAA